MSVVTTVDTSYNTSITVELSKQEKRKRDKEQTLGVIFFLGVYFIVVVILVLL